MDLYVKGKVVRSICRHERKILFVKSAGRTQIWELPGGQIERNEKPIKAANRELKEETGLIAKHFKFITAQRRAIPHNPKIVWDHFLFEAQDFGAPLVSIDGIEIVDFCWKEEGAIAELSLESATQWFLNSAICKQYLQKTAVTA